MKITRTRLNKIIGEEFKKVFEALTDKERRELNTKRKALKRKEDDMKFGGEEIRQMSKGIVSEDNYFRDEDGFFTSAKDASTYSSYFVDGVRKNLSGRTKSVDDSGRGRSKSGQGKYKLKSGEKKFEDMASVSEPTNVTMSMIQLSELVDDCILAFVDGCKRGLREDVVFEDDKEMDWAQACSKRGFKSLQALLSAMNSIALASKGSLK